MALLVLIMTESNWPPQLKLSVSRNTAKSYLPVASFTLCCIAVDSYLVKELKQQFKKVKPSNLGHQVWGLSGIHNFLSKH